MRCGVAQPDIILLDVSMPLVDGLTVSRVLRSEQNHVPVLMLTARTETSDRVAGLDAGADDYLPKPYDLDELLARVRALLRRATYDDDVDGRRGVRGRRPAPRRRGPPGVPRQPGDRAVEDRVRPARTAGAQQGHRARPLDDLRPDLALRLRARLEEPRGLHRLPPSQDRSSTVSRGSSTRCAASATPPGSTGRRPAERCQDR